MCALLQLQHMAAGMADRGASAAVFECSEWGMVSSRFGATHIDVLAFSELAYDKELPHYLETGVHCHAAAGLLHRQRRCSQHVNELDSSCRDSVR